MQTDKEAELMYLSWGETPNTLATCTSQVFLHETDNNITYPWWGGL